MNLNLEAKGGVPATWSAAIAGLDYRVQEARTLLDPFSHRRQREFCPGSVQVLTRPDYPSFSRSQFISRHLSVTYVTPEEILAAPPVIRMVLGDLGLAEEDKVRATVVFRNMEVDYSPRHFWLILRPRRVSEGRVGVILSSIHNNSGWQDDVIVPRSSLRRPRQGRAELVHHTYAADMVSNTSLHPYLVEIICAGAKWMKDLLNNRLSPRPAD